MLVDTKEEPAWGRLAAKDPNMDLASTGTLEKCIATQLSSHKRHALDRSQTWWYSRKLVIPILTHRLEV